jgi:hypothetical protein
MNTKWASIASLLSFICSHPSFVGAHRGNVEPDTGCHVEKAKGTRHCHPERIQESKDEIAKSLNKGKKHGNIANNGTDLF